MALELGPAGEEIFLLGRLLLGGVLAFMGMNHFTDTETMTGYAESKGVRVSGIKDRTYFKSIHISDPDGLVIEFATRGPGMDVDEDEPGS